MRIEIDHRLRLSLPPGPGQLLLHLLLTPGSGTTQTVESWSVEASGIGNAGRFADAYGNMVHLVNQGRAEGAVEIVARGVVVTRDTNGVIGRRPDEPVPALFKRITPDSKAPAEFLANFSVRDSRLDTLHALMAQVGANLAEPAGGQNQMQADGAQTQEQGAEATPDAERQAQLFVAAARALDIPARSVIGYLVGGDDHEGGLHSWAEAYDEGLGWIGFDPVLGLCTTERHVRLATGLDATSAVALRTVPVGTIEQSATVAAA